MIIDELRDELVEISSEASIAMGQSPTRQQLAAEAALILRIEKEQESAPRHYD